MTIKNHLIRPFFILLIISIVFLLPLFKGNEKDPFVYQKSLEQDLGGPFESSNSNSRYALTKSIVDRQSFILDQKLAQFSSPDVSKKNFDYFSIFTPGISFLAVPFYLLGNIYNAPQIGAYTLNILLSLINFILITKIIRRLGFNEWLGYFSGGLFIFATNAYTYAGTLTQHHAVAACLLALILLLLNPISWLNNLLFGLIWGTGLLMDIPFAIMSLPLLITFTLKQLHPKFLHHKLFSVIDFRVISSVLVLLIPITIFAIYNKTTTGSYTSLAQSLGRTRDFRGTTIEAQAITKHPIPETDFGQDNSGLLTTFDTRLISQGLSIFLLSNERGVFYYSPVLLLALLGIIIYYYRSKTPKILTPVLASILISILAYSMFSDPWGGWSFGPRYLIPSAAMAVLFIPYAVRYFRKFKPFHVLTVSLIVASVGINLLGGLTTTLIPPKQEAINLITRIPYTYIYNWQLIHSGNTHSLVYLLIFSRLFSSVYFYYLFTALVSIFIIFIYIRAVRHYGDS